MYRLDVVSSEFRLMLKQIKVYKFEAARTQAATSFHDGAGKLEIGSTSVRFYANGVWPGEARFSASLIYALRHYPPRGDVAITCDGRSLVIGSSKVAATWHSCTPTDAIIPDDADWVSTLVLAATEDGLRRDFGSSVHKAERELARRIARAAAHLAPLGITQSDVRALVEVRMLERRPNGQYFRLDISAHDR